jgi:hypothetical protein
VSPLQNVNVGDLALVTLDNWFYAPDGQSYRAVFGRIKAARTAEDSLGVRPNGKSTNWYLEIGNMLIAGCQIHYVVRTDTCATGEVEAWTEANGEVKKFTRPTHIYDASEVA